ncbi:unnamed protein product, partial [Rotaria sp. Silwood1]
MYIHKTGLAEFRITKLVLMNAHSES